MTKQSSCGRTFSHVSNCSSDTSTFASFWSRDSLCEQPLTWRMDPDSSFSDWVIEISVRGKTFVDSYHVHRAVMGIGQRKSGYFSAIFYREIGGYGTKIVLDEKAALYFSSFLDYVYSDPSFQITTDNAVALGHLADFLVVPKLQKEVEVFIESDLSLGNAGIYLAKALHFRDETLSGKATEKCIEEVIEKCNTTPRTSLAVVIPWAESMIDRVQQQPLWSFVTRAPPETGGFKSFRCDK